MNTKAAETASLIDVRNLVKRYDGKLVLNGFSLTVERGETCVIIGASGSGKSTFARLLVGLERPDSGEIRIAGVKEQLRAKVPPSGMTLQEARELFTQLGGEARLIVRGSSGGAIHWR